MKKYKFRLQKLMDLRKMQKEKALEIFAKEQTKLEVERHKLELFNREANSHIETVREESSQPFKVWAQSVNHSYTRRIKGIMEFQSQKINKQSELVASANAAYLDARKNFKVIEKLKEKTFEEWKLMQARYEDSLADDFNSSSYPGGD